ncbi:phosphate ABC transporter permease PstA [Flavobacterium crassostreae]|uniref:Phosphate transport system permease protein PstA n=1 Tax=Flavobacterium crassostreae TaxID=1763534 RepID=A0A1B9E619_9FLAO|nr:phosphate ABC transporter permease PstA [Flavobacterium crassostreae]OCB77396.1 phosphate ABC transporter, permease protein PstA [Flavobacterium crassostreae]
MSVNNNLAKKKERNQNIAFGIFRLTSYAIVALLFVILAFIVIKGIGVISWEFISEMPKNGMTEGGIFPAIVGTLCLVLVSMVFAFPVGVLAAIYMNEYVKDGIFKKIIKQMTNNLAGVPSIVFGLFGMSLFVNKMGFGDSILAGGLTLGLLVLPIVIRTTEESLKSVDDTFRQASLGLGASKWETTSKVVFPIAFPNVITGLILSIGRVSGETAPILFTVAAYFLPKLPTSIFDQAMALPYHLYVISTSGTNIEASRAMAYGTALVLIIIVLISNILANALRKYYGKKVKMN